MTEAEWLACDDPELMLEFLQGCTSDRKLRLFAVAAFRRAAEKLGREDCERAIEAGERHAEERGHSAPHRAELPGVMFDPPDPDRMLRYLTDPDPITAAWAAFAWASGQRRSFEGYKRYNFPDELTPLAALLRDIFGNPFRPVSVDPAWLTSTVVALAEGVYQDRAFDRLPILADALQDAGCDNTDVLTHCRSDGPHVRGCWVVDMLTGRE